MTGLEQLTAPAGEPITLDEAKLHLRLDTDADDALVDRLIVVARQYCEQFTGRALIAQSWRLTLDRWPGAIVDLPFPPLNAVEAVRTIAADGAATAVSADAYIVDAAVAPGRIIRKSGHAWPAPGRTYKGIEIDYAVGYGASRNDVPEGLRQGMLILIAALYEGREGEGTALPPAVRGTWHPYRLVRL